MFKVFQLWQLPLLSAIIWWGMLIALLACWSAQGKPVYDWMYEVDDGQVDQTFLYISDIAAKNDRANLQPIFIACSAAQGLLFVMSLCAELYLRSVERLQQGIANPRGVKIALGVAVFMALCGELGILFVSIFNTREFHDAHISLLIVFIVCVGVSSLSSIAEYSILGKDYPGKRHVFVSLICRVIWFCIELALAIAFATLRFDHKDQSSGCEWAVSFVYPFYQLIMVWDLWPAHNKTRGHYGDNSKYPVEETFYDTEMVHPSATDAGSEKNFLPHSTNF